MKYKYRVILRAKPKLYDGIDIRVITDTIYSEKKLEEMHEILMKAIEKTKGIIYKEEYKARGRYVDNKSTHFLILTKVNPKTTKTKSISVRVSGDTLIVFKSLTLMMLKMIRS